MVISIGTILDPDARTIVIGDAPAVQTGAGGQWAGAWSKTGVTALQKADASSLTEAWSAVKYTDLLSSALAGGDIYAGDLGVSGQSAATSSVKQQIDGKEGLRFNLAEAASSVAINLSSFFANDDNTGFAEGGRVRLYDAAGSLVGETFVHAAGSSGTQLVQLSSSIAFRSVEISAGSLRADGSFSFGGYATSAGAFGSDVYADTLNAKHGSDFLIDKVTFEIARPVSAGESYSIAEDGSQSFASVLSNDRDPNGAPLSAQLLTAAAHGSLTFNPDGSFSYQPDANFFGADAFTYRAWNGKDYSNSATVQLTVTAVNDAPAAFGDTAATDEDTPVSGNVLTGANGGLDTDVDGDSLVVTNAGTFTTALGASVTLSANGNFVYDARTSVSLQALGAGASGLDGFDYSISDGHGGTSSAHVAVTVAGMDEAPPGALAPSTEAGAPLTYYLRYTSTTGTASKWLEVGSFNVAFDVEVSFMPGGGAGHGKAVASDFLTSLGSSDAALDLTRTLLEGRTLRSVEVEAYRPGQGSSPQLVAEYKLGQVALTSANTWGGGTGFGFDFATFGQSVSPLDSKGRPITAVKTGWDFARNQQDLSGAVLPDPGPDAATGNLGGQLPRDTHLDYYVRFDNSSAWLPLSSFDMGYDAASSLAAGSGASIGRPISSGVSMSLGSSAALTALLGNLGTGAAVNKIEVEAYSRTVDGPKLVDEYIFNGSYVTGLHSSAISSNALSLSYRTFTHGHQNYAAGGHESTWTGVGYDNAAQDLVSAPRPVPTAMPGPDVDLAPSTEEAGAPLTYYLRYTSTTGTASKWLEVGAFQVAFDAAVSVTPGGGVGHGKAVASDFLTLLSSSDAALDLTRTLLQGRILQSVEVEAYQPGQGSSPQLVAEYKLGKVALTSVNTAGGTSSTRNGIGFDFGTFGQSVSPLDSKGRPVAPVKMGWDFTQNQQDLSGAVVPDPGPDALNGNLGNQLPQDTHLDYYVRFDSSSAWLPLSGFAMGYDAASSSTAGSGASIGKPISSGVSMSLGSSAALTALLGNLGTGAAVNQIEVEAYLRTSDGPKLVDEYIFNGSYVTGLHSSAITSNALSLSYRTFTHGHQNYAAGGHESTWTGVGYDNAAQDLVSAPRPVPTAVPGPGVDLAPSTEAWVPLTYYLRYTSTTGIASKWLEVGSFQVGFNAEVSVTPGGGVGHGKAVAGDFLTLLGSSDAALELTRALLQGRILQSVEVEAYQPGQGAASQLVAEYKLGQVALTSVDTWGSASPTGNDLQFDFATFGQSVSPLDNQGRPIAAVKTGWDFVQNKQDLSGAVLPDPGPDALIGNLGNQLPKNAPLEYYVRFDSSSAWLLLSDFTMGYDAPSSLTAGSGTSIGKPISSGVSMTLGSSAALTALLGNLGTGAVVSKIEIEAYSRAIDADGPRLVDEYIFNGAYVTGLESGNMSSNTLNLAYKTFTHGHQNYAADGHGSTWTGVGFDNTTLTLVGAPPPHPDVLFV